MREKKHSKKQLSSLLDPYVKPTYSQEILTMPYPTGYTVPKFIKFDGKQGYAREYVVRFIETLGVHGSDHSLRLREFSKSLTKRAYSWYVNFAPNSIKSWEEMVNKFHTKFIQVQEKVTTLTLGWDVQKEGEDILDYVKWFQDKAIDCHEPVDEAHLVSICVKGAIRDYKSFLVNHNLPIFSALIEAARNLSSTDPLHRSRDSHRYSRSSRIAVVTSTRGSRLQAEASSSRKRKSYEDKNSYPRSLENVKTLAKEWVADGELTLPPVDVTPTKKDKESPDYCVYHRTTRHFTKNCWTLKSIFKEKVDANELKFKDVGNHDVRKDPYLNHKENEKNVHMIGYLRLVLDQVHMASYYDELEEIASGQLLKTVPAEEKFVEDTHAQALQNSRKFHTFFDQLGLSQAGRLEATKALINISKVHHAEVAEAKEYVLRRIQEDYGAITFSEADKAYPFPHNRPLFVTAYINDVEFKCAFLDGGASINIITTDTFARAGIPKSRMARQPITVIGFGGEKKVTRGHVVVDLAVGEICFATKFHVIDADTNYHMILGRAWMHRYGAIPSSYHQCVKAKLEKCTVTINAFEKPFRVEEAHYSDAVFFTELSMDETPRTGKIARVKLLKWEDI
ncbi:uncharacterized protein LOC114265167 [Camellia sinensis]|uniref:uncharacterized protein LOC114265167 n=1 Tax=Camellia sinensis TaxID=4442 RepID=UPI0010361304|nr:uncharacterized protein LOC114265167 [Camellia sinensis]